MKYPNIEEMEKTLAKIQRCGFKGEWLMMALETLKLQHQLLQQNLKLVMETS